MMWIQHSLRVAWINRLAKEAFSAGICTNHALKIKHIRNDLWWQIFIHCVSKNVHPFSLPFIFWITPWKNQRILIFWYTTFWRNLKRRKINKCAPAPHTNSCMPHCKIVIFQLFNNDFYIKHLFFSHFPSIHHFKIVNYMRHFTSWRFIQWMFNVAPTRMWSAGKKIRVSPFCVVHMHTVAHVRKVFSRAWLAWSYTCKHFPI